MNSKKNLKRNLLICLLAGSAVMYTLPLHAATSVIANNTLPTGGKVMAGNITLPNWVNTPDHGKLVMDITQSTTNGVIKWDSFDVGGSATVNFKGPQVEGGYNTLNYVNAGGSMSQIYGTINANNNGNIFIVNPAGVQIGNSAQINVGSLHVSNKTFSDDLLKSVNESTVLNDFMQEGSTGDAALMSLGNINANNVTFEGNGRIVIDSERLKDVAGDEKLNYQNINIKTSEKNKNNIIIGYEAYDEENKTYDGANTSGAGSVATVNGNAFTKADGYMWVEDVEQLQAINTNLGGNYALRNSIDATSTATWNSGAGFNPIGLDTNGKVIVKVNNNNKEYGFIGNFDGLDYNVFGLTINRKDEANVGLFGVAHNANINNVTLVGGSITGGSVVGSVVGAALGNTHITNVTNGASVTGNTDVGGIVGYSGDDIDYTENGNISGITADAHFSNLINTGAVHSNGENDTKNDTNSDKISNAGGLIGYMYNGTLDGNSYNLGDVSGDGYNVGGLVGHAVSSTIGNPSVVDGKPVENVQVVYNRLDVTGAYNVGGIVGNMEGSIVQNAENSGTVLAEKYKTEYYTYHTGNQTYDSYYGTSDDGISGVEVNVANVGGIVGTSSASNNGKASKIENVTNTANVSSDTDTYNQYGSENEYYIAGNVAGIVGRAEDTDISNATNQENEIRGAHNVGGVAGYFGTSDDNSDNKYTVTNGINDGGDIMATGARAKQGVNNSNLVNDKGFALEQVRSVSGGSETVIIGNMGGVVGYLEGDNVYVTSSANRGIVHSQEITNPNQVLYTSQAANTGGVVGKLDTDRNRDLSDEEKLKGLQGKTITAAVSDSYNTGNISGYTGVGGIIGMMYNGEVANSYNIGAINTTRRPVSDANGDTVNMGGVVGDTTEEAGASAVIYNVYNEGQIGDDEYNYYARHIGGVVGRLSGIVDKAYNTGDIYSGYSVVGGIVGWLYEGTVSNAFNTGNITTVNNDRQNNGSQVGGIAGAVAGYNTYDANVSNRLYNAYNLGTIRSFTGESNYIDMGGIVGKIVAGANNQATVNIENVYTTANLYTNSNNTGSDGTYGAYRDIGSIYGQNSIGTGLTVNNANYVQFENYNNFNNLTNTNNNGRNGEKINIVSYKNRYSHDAYDLVNIDTDKTWSEISGGSVGKGDWRYYDGKTMPILNAFLPNAEDYFSGETGHTNTMNGIDSIQYGTAYNPLLTIINANVDTDNLTFDWGDLGITGAASIAVYNSGLTLYNVDTSDGTGYYGGLLYSDGDLSLNTSNKDGEAEDGVSGNISLGSGAKLYGSSVDINADGTVTIYGSVTASGNKGESNIKITVGDVNVYGTMVSVAEGGKTSISGIADSAAADNFDFGNITDRNQAATSIGNRYGESVESQGTGSITINSGTKTVVNNDGSTSTIAIGNGNVNLYFGNKEQGLITTGGDLTVTGTGDVYVDSDLDIGGNLTLNGTGADSEVVLDITNIGQVQAKNGTVTDAVTGLHNFMHHFSNTDGGGTQAGRAVITLNAEQSGDAKLAVDMWDYESNSFDLKKYDSNGHTFKDELDKVTIRDIDNNELTASEVTYIWVTDADQLQGINNNGTDGLEYNYALKGDINASGVNNYEAIGTGSNTGFTGTFDGRGNRVIGLTVDKVDGKDTANAGIFDTIGTNGVVKDVNIYSGNFTGSANAGAVAGKNNGRIEGVVTFGNTVTSAGNAGGIVGENKGSSQFDENGNLTGSGIYDVESTGSVIAGSDTAVAGGLVGTNNGALGNSFSDSAVTVATGVTLDKDTTALGGVVGINNGNVQYVDSLGVTNGGATGSSNIGGIIGTNKGNMYSGFNESIVSGKDKVGGIIGNNTGTVTNIVNASSVDGFDTENASGTMAESNYVGGLVGTNSGSVTNGRNNGTITGTNYVGGMVGNNADKKSILTNLVNDSSAEITGIENVGGIAGNNEGTITTGKADDEDEKANLINRGSITGHTNVGGVAGTNSGTIENANNDVELNVNPDGKDDAQFFGGIAGVNTGTITDATNTANVNADGASYVGGIVGLNNGTLKDMAGNSGNVTGKDFVGGVVGQNKYDINGVNASNTGVVNATDGGAGGLIAHNTGVLNNITMINAGLVTGTGTDGDSGTGGLIGYNEGDITNSVLENTVGFEINDETFDGVVTGVSNVGGVIGINTGKIENTSLMNKADITVNVDENENAENIGGLIGKNTGTVTGGRDASDSYYKYQIYNNGVITVNGNGSNIGGLIGNNEINGSLSKGYNTGAIYASGSKNVGGIVGNNEGTIGEVFNTVMVNPADTNQNVAITGGTNVGGLVGTNSGTISNAYNTTEVNGKADSTGNAVGVNNDNATVSNVYDVTNTNNKLIGENSNGAIVDNSYTSAKQEESADGTDGITYISADKAKYKESYKNFADGTWKFYDGYSNPLLSVFLTKVKVNQDKVNEYMNKHKVYNGSMQELTAYDIRNLIESGAISVKGLTKKEDAFEAFNNNNSLISSIGYKDVGKHNDWLYSGQIAETTGNTFNPNNLGYDIELTASIAQAELSISDILANIVYGGNTYTDIAGGSLTGIINNDDVYLRDKNGNKISITSDLIADYLSEDYAANKGNRNTADVKRDQNNNVIAYEDAISVDGISLGGTASGNYKLTDTTISGDITVTPATLNITLNDIYRIYGDHKTIYSNYDATQTGDYGIKNVSELVNGDQDSLNELIVTAISDGALDDFENPTKTNDVTKDGYKWTGEFSGISNVNSNYTITVRGGNSIVKAKTITIKDLLASIVYGNQDNKGLQINTGASLADGSIVYGDDLDVSLVVDNAQYTTGGAYEDNKGGRTTADVGEYTNSLFVSGLSLTGDKAGNYVLNTTAAVGNIEVTKANLIINVGNAETVYGDAFNDNDYTHTLSGVTNGDSDTVIDGLLGGNYDNTVSVEAGKDTANAGTYKDALGFVNYQQLKNYDVQVENGDVIINKKQITIGANDEQILVGETPNYSGTDIDSVLVNGDSLNGNYHYGVEDSSIESVVGTHNGTIGVWIGGSFYDLSNPDWSNLPGMSFFANYNVTFEPGTLTVSAYDIPEDWPHNRWDYLFNDAPFDRNKDFRERKAEVNFVDGGMEI